MRGAQLMTFILSIWNALPVQACVFSSQW